MTAAVSHVLPAGYQSHTNEFVDLRSKRADAGEAMHAGSGQQSYSRIDLC